MADHERMHQRNGRGVHIVYWGLLVGAWLVFLPNIFGIKGTDGNPCILWLLSPILGLIATGLAIWDKSLSRTIVALLFGVGAVSIIYIAVLLISGP